MRQLRRKEFTGLPFEVAAVRKVCVLAKILTNLLSILWFASMQM